MKKLVLSVAVIAAMGMTSCGEAALTAETAAEKWCVLNSAVKDAEDGDAKDKAKEAREAFEDEIEKLYEEDEAAMKTIKKLKSL